MIIILLEEVLQYQKINLALILLWGAHLHNQTDMKLSLLRLILNQIFIQRELHIRILLE